MPILATTVDRFWLSVNKDGPIHPIHGQCWVWTKSTRGQNKYGQFHISHFEPVMAHRFSWRIHHGEIPEDLRVLHKCDNPICVNPDHLFLGTDADNMADKSRKGRGNAPTGGRHWTNLYPELRTYGERSNLTSLTKEDVLEIRRRYWAGEFQGTLAKEFGVAQSTICRIVNRKRWSHV